MKGLENKAYSLLLIGTMAFAIFILLQKLEYS